MIKRFLSYLILISVFFQNTFFIVFADEQVENQILLKQVENSENTSSWTINQIQTQETNSWVTEQIPEQNTSSWIINTNSWTTETNSWTIENTSSWAIETNTWVIENTSSWTIEINTWSTENQNRFVLEFQNPSYVFPWSIENEFLCDKTNSDCKVNFNIDDLELTSFSTKFYCKSDFGFVTGEEDECNPSTITFWTWTFNLNFKVFKKADNSLIWKKDIKIKNIKEDIETNSWTTENTNSWIIETNSWTTENTNSWIIETNSWTTENINTWNIIIPKPIITIQSGLVTTDIVDKFKCKDLNCSINLTAADSFSWTYLEKDYSCLWDFWSWTFSSEDTINKCNPSYVKYWTWNFSINLKIISKNDNTKILEKTIFIENIESIKKSTPSSTSSSSSSSSQNISNTIVEKYNSPPFANIILQWKQTKNKIVENNKITCTWIKECSINFSAEGTYDLEKDKLSYFWDFWNGEYFVWKNPKTIVYKSWKYSVILEVRDKVNMSKVSFIVEVKEEKPEEKLFIIDENLSSSLKIYWVLANSSGKDDFEYLILENIWKQDINLFWLIIDDELENGSLAYVVDYNLLLKAGQKKKFYKSETGLIFWNISDSANIIYNNVLIDSLSWDFSIKEDVLLTKDWLQEKKKDLYDLSFLLEDFSFEEIFYKKSLLEKDISLNIKSFLGNIHPKNFITIKELPDSQIISELPKWFKTSNKIQSEFEKKLKNSIIYKVSKNKKAFKVLWNSTFYKDIVLVFNDEKIQLKTDKLGNFAYETRKLEAWEFKLEFLWLDELWEIFLKNSREINLTSDYVNSVLDYKKKIKKIKVKKKKIKKVKIKKQKELKVSYENISKDIFNETKISIILYLFLWSFSIVFLFLILRRRWILES